MGTPDFLWPPEGWNQQWLWQERVNGDTLFKKYRRPNKGMNIDQWQLRIS